MIARILFIIFTLHIVTSLPNPTYTIHYVRNYRRDQIDSNFGCGKSVVYGTYIHPLGLVDGLYALSNSHIYGFNGNCQRKDTYMKIFGEDQNYQLLQSQTTSVIDRIAGELGRIPTRNLIVDWKYLPQESKLGKARQMLEDIVSQLQKKAYTVFVKAPASYFCLQVEGKRYILDLPASNYIVELYGEEAGQYTTYESIFGSGDGKTENGYTSDCPKYPTQQQLKISSGNKRIYFQKTLDYSLPGFISTSTWEKFLQKAGEDKYNAIYFYDGFPNQTVEF